MRQRVTREEFASFDAPKPSNTRANSKKKGRNGNHGNTKKDRRRVALLRLAMAQLLVILVLFMAAALGQTTVSSSLDAPFAVGFAANLNVVDAQLILTNGGYHGPGSLCASIFTYSPDSAAEIACCQKNIPFGQTVRMSVINHLLNGAAVPPSNSTIHYIITTETECGVTNNAARVGSPGTGVVSWMVNYHVLPRPALAGSGSSVASSIATFGVTQTQNVPATLSLAAYLTMIDACQTLAGFAPPDCLSTVGGW